VYAQIIDNTGKTLVGLSEKKLIKTEKLSPMERSKQLGTEIAKKAQEKKIKEVAFDKGRLAYHGRVKALAEGAREGGLQF
jgi:large subunit ribosomal protein L18